MKPDQLSEDIIDRLRKGDTSNSEIARSLGVSEGTIRQRVRKLRDAGVVSVKGLINPDTLADQQLAIMMITVAESRMLEEKAREIAELPNVLSAMIVSGRYDIMAEVLVDSNMGMVRFITESLSKIQGVNSTETFVVLKSHKKWV